MPLFRTLILWALMFAALVMMFSQFRSHNRRQCHPLLRIHEPCQQRPASPPSKSTKAKGRLYGRDDLGNVTITDAPADVFMIPDLRAAGVLVEAEPQEKRSLLMTISHLLVPHHLPHRGLSVPHAPNAGRSGRRLLLRAKTAPASLARAKTPSPLKMSPAATKPRKKSWKLSTFSKARQNSAGWAQNPPRRAPRRQPRHRQKRCWPKQLPAKRKSPSSASSGSDFVEMFVRRSAPPRVRDMFEQAKQTRRLHRLH